MERKRERGRENLVRSDVYLQTAPSAVFSDDANIRRIDAGAKESA